LGDWAVPAADKSSSQSITNQPTTMGEGMPWHIIMVFFALGMYLGIKSGQKDHAKRAAQHAQNDKANTTNNTQ
jgi:hypothetical protein